MPKRTQGQGTLAAKKAEKQKLLTSMQLKQISMDQAHVLHTGFLVMDEDEDGLLSLQDVYTWFRANGWCWTDERLDAALRRGGQGSEKVTFSVIELLRCADSYFHERFELERDGPKVSETFATFDFEGHGSLMRADLHKFLQNHCGPAECNHMLETLGYPNNALTFTVEELTRRTADQLNEPRTEQFAESVGSVA